MRKVMTPLGGRKWKAEKAKEEGVGSVKEEKTGIRG